MRPGEEDCGYTKVSGSDDKEHCKLTSQIRSNMHKWMQWKVEIVERTDGLCIKLEIGFLHHCWAFCSLVAWKHIMSSEGISCTSYFLTKFS